MRCLGAEILLIMVEDVIWRRRIVEYSLKVCFLCTEKVFLQLHKIVVESLSHGLFY